MPEQETLYSKYKYIWEQLDNTMDSLFSYIQHYPVIEMDSYGNITVCNTKQKNLPVFCCHLDTIHTKEPNLELVHGQILVSFDGGGVGGDDKCGIIACLEMLESDIPCKCIFFRDEERGCAGSNKFNAKSLKDDLFCIEIDRRGANDLVFSACRGEMCNEEFKARVKRAFPHGVEARGSLTDVCVLGDAGINMMYISGGYYRPHTDKEYVVLPELELNIECLKKLAKDILENPLKDKTYKRSVMSYGYSYYSKQGGNKNEKASKQESLFPGTAGEDDYRACQYGVIGEADQEEFEEWEKTFRH